MLSFKPGTLSTLWKTSKTQATRTAHNHEKAASALFSRRSAMREWRSQNSRRREAWQSRREVGDAIS